MAKKDALEKQTGGSLEQRPDFIKQSQRGQDAVEQKDLTLPRLGLCQSGSPQRKKSSPLFIEGLTDGEFFNTITGEIYGEGPISFTPLFMYKSRIKFNAFDDGGGIDCQSFNSIDGGRHSKTCAECPFSQWGDGAPDCLLLYNYPVLILPKRELAVLSLKSTAVKIAKQFNSLIQLRNADSFAGLYTIQSALETRQGNEFATLVIKNAGWVDAATYQLAEGFFEQLKGKTIQTDLSEPESF
jgi:hypothetical protein